MLGSEPVFGVWGNSTRASSGGRFHRTQAGLQARWKAVVHEMAETPKRASEAEKSHGSQTTRSRTEGVVLQDLCECKPGLFKSNP